MCRIETLVETMTSAVTTTSIVYTDQLHQVESYSSLKPFFVSVSFQGNLPAHVVQPAEIVSHRLDSCYKYASNLNSKPLQISVSIPQEYAGFMSPVLRAAPSPVDEIEVQNSHQEECLVS